MEYVIGAIVVAILGFMFLNRKKPEVAQQIVEEVKAAEQVVVEEVKTVVEEVKEVAKKTRKPRAKAAEPKAKKAATTKKTAPKKPRAKKPTTK